jgi:hypothetical protein
VLGEPQIVEKKVNDPQAEEEDEQTARTRYQRQAEGIMMQDPAKIGGDKANDEPVTGFGNDDLWISGPAAGGAPK